MQEREGKACEPTDGQEAPRERRHQAMDRVQLRSRFGGHGSRETGGCTKGRDPEILAVVASIAAHNRLRQVRFGIVMILRKKDWYEYRDNGHRRRSGRHVHRTKVNI